MEKLTQEAIERIECFTKALQKEMKANNVRLGFELESHSLVIQDVETERIDMIRLKELNTAVEK